MISTIGDISASTTTTTTETASATKTLDQDAFLEILVAQLQNQDPLDPMDNTDYTAVLAQFSSLAQMSSMNSKLDNIASIVESSSATNTANLIGKEVSAAGGTLSVNGSSTNVAYSLPEDATSCQVNIYGADDGLLAASFDLGTQAAGEHSIAWDTSSVSSGNYSVEVSAYDGSGNAITATTMISGTVTGVTAESGTLCVVVNGLSLPYDDIISINA